MIRQLLARFAHAPEGGTADVVLSHLGLAPGPAALLFLIGAVVSWWLYRWAAPNLSLGKRWTLLALRVLLLGLIIALLVKPVVLLTLNEPVRQRLLVALDSSLSMGIKDHRTSNEDRNRAAIAAGIAEPKSELNGPAAAGAEKWQESSREDLLQALAGNQRLNLWPRLAEKADLAFYGFGAEARPIGGGSTESEGKAKFTTEDAAAFFKKLAPSENVTAIGSSLQQLLEENRGQSVAGILVITDGANNSGSPPEEVAQIAKQDGVPLYLYGIGITGPKDIIVRDLTGPRGAFIKERAEFTVKVRAPGFTSRTVRLVLKANGKKVDDREIKLNEAETEYQLGFVPQDKGEAQMEALIEPLDEESSRDNNVATAKVRVLDNQVRVLYVEGEPRWDFRYLLSTLERDHRLVTKCVLFEGGAELAGEPESPFLKDFPATRAELVANEIIVLGDVDPKTLGDARMKLINEWVGELGGGLIFLAGEKHNPLQYIGTPLEPLLPVQLDRTVTEEQYAERSRNPLRLKMTSTGELSPLLRLSDNSLENRQIWNGFPGVHWTARVAKARPTAQTYLVDTDPEHAVKGEARPVIAQQAYGQGLVMYFGFDETYRWRSQTGEKYYARIWNQVIQNFSLERQLGASAKTQLKAARPEYFTGEKVVISGKIFGDHFAPLNEPSVPGTLSIEKGTPDGKDATSELRLMETPDHPGEYTAEFTAKVAGEYRFSTIMDPKAVVKLSVASPKLEQSQTAMDASLLQTMAEISGGKFLREENLDQLPDVIAARSATVPTFKTVELFYSPAWMIALMLLAATEWLLRRLWQLK